MSILAARLILALGATAAAAAWDVRTRRIPNALTAGAFGLALALAAAGGGLHGLTGALAGAAVAGLPLLAARILGMCGLGDAKLGFALGACLGLSQAVVALLWGTVLGGVLTAAWLGCRLVRRVPEALAAWGSHGPAALAVFASDPAWRTPLPYGAFLAAGTWLAVALAMLRP